jgi:hypothetical protein
MADGLGKKSEIITVPSLKTFFFESLSKANKNSVCPLPEETLFYSSDVLERYSLSDEFFQVEGKKVREKVSW